VAQGQNVAPAKEGGGTERGWSSELSRFLDPLDVDAHRVHPELKHIVGLVEF
jgi:hypothetical protein